MDHETIVRVRDLRSAGEAPSKLYRGAHAGLFERVGRGLYAESAGWQQLGDRERHLALMRAVHSRREGDVFSHQSAAAAWGLPTLGRLPDRPHLIVRSEHGVSRRSTFHAHHGRLADSEVTIASGLVVTAPLRTGVDVAATTSMLAGALILDAVIAQHLDGDVDAARAYVERRRPFRGVGRVVAALRHCTGLAESPLESLSLVRFAELGLPRPEQQRPFTTSAGDFVVDFYWSQFDVIGEADGWAKYGSAAAEREAAFRAEKRREDALRARVQGFVRWEWADAWRPERLKRRLEAAGVNRDRAIDSRSRD